MSLDIDRLTLCEGMCEKPSSLKTTRVQRLCEVFMRGLLAIAALVFCCPTFADWIFVEKSDTANHYIDLETIRRKGGLVDVWQLTNLNVRDEDGTISRQGLQQFDCRERRWRLLFLSFHSEHWAGGKTIVSESIDNHQSKWEQIPPRTIGDVIHKMVCKK